MHDDAALAEGTHGHGEEDAHAVPYGFYILIWVALLVLTQFTVAAAQLHLGPLGILIATVITPVKAMLVLLYFMHLRYESPLFKGMFVFAVMSLVAAIGLTFFDYSFR